MLKFFLLLALLLSTALWAQDATEEAIILNQELQFLEESANNMTLTSQENGSKDEFKRSELPSKSLENEYFGNDSEETISTKAAAPKRRSL